MSLALAVDAAPPSKSDAEFARDRIARACERACGRIAPLWPLRQFVAVNPFLGFTGESFASACASLRRIAGAEMLMPRAFYRRTLADGTVTDLDLAVALARAGEGGRTAALDVAGLRRAARTDPMPLRRPEEVVATVADVLDALADGNRQTSRTAFMVDEISRWCAAWFDEGQAAWGPPGRTLKAYAAWRAAARHDCNPEVMGVTGFRATIAELPEEPLDAIATVVGRLGIPEQALEDYLFRALFDIGGWAAFVRHRVWTEALHGREDDTLVQLLAIRLAWGYALFRERRDEAFRSAWTATIAAAARPPTGSQEDGDLAVDLLLHDAFEIAFQRRLATRLTAAAGSGAQAGPPLKSESARPPVQAAFCIDVRSEVYRRALERVCPEAETLGFAGFFGFPIEYVPIGRTSGDAQCPVLLTPSAVVCEGVAGAGAEEEARILGLRRSRRRVAKAWKAFKLSAVSSFAFVETSGLAFAAKIAGDAFGLSRTVGDPRVDGVDAEIAPRLGPRIEPRLVDGRETGFAPDRRLDMAEAVLRGMSLTKGFAPLVLLIGHGGNTVNNPHAAGLDCGACGGHSGEANARVAAAVLNDPSVRAGLGKRGIAIPEDSRFIAALHDTTTDAVRLFELEAAPPGVAGDFARLRAWLAEASILARAERAPRLGVDVAKDPDRAVIARSRDWAQVRPEWGLAGAAAFIAAPRARTRDTDLGGRAFLHSYDWTQDEGFTVLELIMTAPMIVASWISLQYYGSTVNNRLFGAGDKTLHNVTGLLGVLEGNAGDLRVGLPWQSVHDGVRLVHEPLRLNVIIEAPEPAIARVIARNPGVRDLVENGWIHLFAIGPGGRTLRRYAGAGSWEGPL